MIGFRMVEILEPSLGNESQKLSGDELAYFAVLGFSTRILVCYYPARFMNRQEIWERFKKYYSEYPKLGLALDLSRMNVTDEFFASMESRMQKAFAAMSELEKGAIANPDENRMVGHYWLRNPALAPTAEIRKAIEETIVDIENFAADVHSGRLRGAGGNFKNLLLIGIGGSALGPQFVSCALSHPKRDKMRLFTFDNTDPDGMDRVIAQIGSELGQTLCIVISKSGGTKETRNGMLEAEAFFAEANFEFSKQTIAITQQGSELSAYATKNKWLKQFPMWDWVGGRTSELSAVGLVPAALQGFDIRSLLEGAKQCDEATRKPVTMCNPAALLSLAWFCSGNGKGEKVMVILPYKDRLELFSKYLQQLVMESLGKEKDLAGNCVQQGFYVFGNKGSTDQHAYVQQLRDGISNFFVTFLEVLTDRETAGPEVEPNTHSGDYLSGFLLGTRKALSENGRESLILTISRVDAFSVGLLIALFERAVGFYASLINVNAYHQPGVEAGKKAASEILKLQNQVLDSLKQSGYALTVAQIASSLKSEDLESIYKICLHLAANPANKVRFDEASPDLALFSFRT
jgi:glucose-6-phosphate isomerase